MSHHDKQKTSVFSPFCLRFSFEERAKLEQEAGNQPLGTYIRSRLFKNPTPRKRKKRRKPEYNEKLLAKILHELGASRIASNLNQIARAVNSGSLIVSPETEKAIQDACKAIVAIRHMLMRALGLLPKEKDDT